MAFEQRDDIRNKFCSPILNGVGVEIGGGAFPQSLPASATAKYYDIRNEEAAENLFGSEVVAAKPMSMIKADFQNGADFLIAHNVLEHCPDPVGTLIEWNGYVRNGGVVVISLPHYEYCDDSDRRLPPSKHLIEDFLIKSDGLDFSSREHTASFTLGWFRDYCRSQNIKGIPDFSFSLLRGLHRDDHDIHWHALDSRLAIYIVFASSMLGGRGIKIINTYFPEAGQTVGDILIAYKIGEKTFNSYATTLAELEAKKAYCLKNLEAEIFSQADHIMHDKDRHALLKRPFVKEAEHCFVAKIPESMMLRISSGQNIRVREGLKVLPLADCLHDDIRAIGMGRYSIWKESVYFSSSDNTDCNSNQRNYFIFSE